MAQEKELKEPLKNLVKETVGNIVSQLVKASAAKTVAELRKRLKEETLHRVEAKLKGAAEEQLEKQLARSGRGLQKAIGQDNPSGQEYAGKLKQVFEKDFGKFLSSLKGMSTLAVVTISCVCTLVISAVLGWVVFYFEPPPQPDLVITSITLQLETSGTVSEFSGDSDITFEVASEFASPYYLFIHYTIENQGDKAAEPSTSCLYLCGDIVAEDTVGPLEAGETADGAFYYPFLREFICTNFCYSYGDFDLMICADCSDDVEESREENNCITLQLNQPPFLSE